MNNPKKRFAAIVIARGVELLDSRDDAVDPIGSVRRADLEPLFSGDVLGVGAVAPRFLVELGLADSVSTIAIPPGRQPDLSANGRLILDEVRRAIEAQNEGRLQALRIWFPWILRTRTVHAFLDALPALRAAQIAGLRRGRGRPTSSSDQASLIVTMDFLADRGLSIAQAAEKIASLRGVHVNAERLRNMHSELRELVRCIKEGYWLPAAEVAYQPWGADPRDEFAVYLKT